MLNAIKNHIKKHNGQFVNTLIVLMLSLCLFTMLNAIYPGNVILQILLVIQTIGVLSMIFIMFMWKR